MNLQSKRLLLKDVTWEDLENLFYLHSFPEIDQYNTIGIPKDREAMKEIMRPAIEDREKKLGKIKYWTISEQKGGKFIGEAGMFLSADRFKLGEIYYNLLPEYWGSGYGTETVKTMIRYGFDQLDLHKIDAGVATENIRSVRVLEKVGMTREGLRRKILPIRGEWKDNYHFGIVEDDPREY